jgi:DNA-binding transcriptional regulator YdaS (Cro superfamily)
MNDKQHDQSMRNVQLAIDRIGSMKETADAVGCSYRQVIRWRDGENEISAENAVKLAEAAELKPGDLRPDIFS